MSHPDAASPKAETAKAADQPETNADKAERDYGMFDAELSGAVLNMSLLGRILGWMRPYKYMFALSAALVLLWSTLHVMLPIIISVVVIDHILRGCLLYTSPSPRDLSTSRMPSSA